MEQPIFLDFPRHVREQIKPIAYRPPFSKYYIPGTACQLIPWPQCPIIRYHVSHFTFRLEFLELEAAATTRIPFMVKRPSTFLTFNLDGALSIFNPAGDALWQVPEKMFFPTYKGPSNLRLELHTGIHRIAVATFNPLYLLSEEANFPLLAPLFDYIRQEEPDPLIFPYCPMGTSIGKHLDDMRSYPVHPGAERGSFIFHKLVQCLQFHQQLVKGGRYKKDVSHDVHLKALADFVEQYVFTEKADDATFIASQLGIKVWKVRELALEVYKMPLHHYVIERRIGQAKILLINTNKKIKEIALSIGYADCHYFCRVFKKVTGSTTSKFRINHKNSP